MPDPSAILPAVLLAGVPTEDDAPRGLCISIVVTSGHVEINTFP